LFQDKSDGIPDNNVDHALAGVRDLFSKFEDESWLTWGNIIHPRLEEHIKQRKDHEEFNKRLSKLDAHESTRNTREEACQLSEGPLIV
jgi:hypothetical protein